MDPRPHPALQLPLPAICFPIHRLFVVKQVGDNHLSRRVSVSIERFSASAFMRTA